MTDLDKLVALAAAATPGPREVRIAADARVYRANGSYIDFGDAIYHPENSADAALFAACDPATIHDLVAAARDVPWWPLGDPTRMAQLDAWAEKYVLHRKDGAS